MLTDATRENLRRKSGYIDIVHIYDGLPIFSWIDINTTELCNRKCVFCPRIEEIVYPNQHLHMDVELAQKIAAQLEELQYKGVVVFSGYSEPTLCPNFEEIVAAFSKTIRLELVTNGDTLTVRRIIALKEAGIDFFGVSLYDGPEQIDHFKQLFTQAGLTTDNYILRDRWHTAEDGFGLKLTNRAGTVSVGMQSEADINHPCYYTAYSLTVDWNGDVLLCMQDWHKKVKFGNINTSLLISIWKSRALNRYRQKLLNGSRDCSPCRLCNTDGTLHGHTHAEVWRPLMK